MELADHLRNVSPGSKARLPRVFRKTVIKAVSENNAYRIFLRKQVCDVKAAIHYVLVIVGKGC